MKKNILRAMVVLAIINCTIFISDGLTWLVSSLMALAIMGIIHRYRIRVSKITRWAKVNPRKAQVLITVLQLGFMALGIFAGYNLKESGYELSDTTGYLFSTIIVAGFLSVPFLPKRGAIPILQVVNRHRLAYMGIALSSFVLMVLFGNRLEDRYQNSPITQVVRAIDKTIFPDNSTNADLNDAALKPAYGKTYGQALTGPSSMAVFAAYTIFDKETITSPTLSKKELREKLKTERKAKRFERQKHKMVNLILKKRLALAAGLGAGAVILIVLLVITTCAGVCLLIAGFAGGEIGVGILGVIVAAASVFGIVKITQSNKKASKTEP